MSLNQHRAKAMIDILSAQQQVEIKCLDSFKGISLADEAVMWKVARCVLANPHECLFPNRLCFFCDKEAHLGHGPLISSVGRTESAGIKD